MDLYCSRLAELRWQYTHGVANPESVPPESYTLDTALLERPGNKEIQLDLFLDYASNVKLYSKFQDARVEAALAGDLGQERPFLRASGSRSLSEGHTRSEDSVP